MKNRFLLLLLSFLLALSLLLSGCTLPEDIPGLGSTDVSNPALPEENIDLSNIPEYAGSPYIPINQNIPTFTSEEITTDSYEYYSALDNLGRCGVTVACIGKDLMPTEVRGDIDSVTPTGWVQGKYTGQWLYNRCHLIGFQLTGENANPNNLITGTRYLNIEGMLPFENQIADYIKETGNHVMYRVTPIFEGDNLLAKGVHLEAYSVEDQGDGISFNVFSYNVQPGVVLDYATGKNHAVGASDSDVEDTYILNTKTNKFHTEDCTYAKNTAESNKESYTGSRQDLIDEGYSPCGVCDP